MNEPTPRPADVDARTEPTAAHAEHPAGDIQPVRSTAVGRRVALMMGCAALAVATVAETTSVSCFPGGGA